MRASLERNFGQSKFHRIYIGPSFKSRIRNQEGKDLMATDMGKLQKIKNIIWPHNLKKRCIKREFTGIHDRLLRDPDFSQMYARKTIKMEMFVVNVTILQNKITPVECQNQNTFTTSKIGGSLSISRESMPNQ